MVIYWVPVMVLLTSVAFLHAEDETEVATFAGGCFWCMQTPFEELDGVVKTVVGYAGGRVENPSYEAVSSGKTGHAEAVQVVFRPDKVSYEAILERFWHNIDPTTSNRQFCDVGSQYRSAIFYHSEAQKEAALASKAAVEKRLGQKVVTEVVPFTNFYRAEEYHQDYHSKNPLRYQLYRYSCGRDDRLEDLWGEPDAQ